METEHVTLGCLRYLVAEVGQDILADVAKVRYVLDKDVQVLRSFGRAGCFIIRSAFRPWVSGLAKALYFVPWDDGDGPSWGLGYECWAGHS